MNPNTGALYGSMQEAFDAGESAADLVEIRGPKELVEQVSEKVKTANEARADENKRARNRSANKRARKSRKRNR